MDFDVLKRVLAALEAHGVKYVVFGAVALNLHGFARATEDVDLFIAPEEENVDRLKAALRDVFDDPEIETITARDLLGSYPAVQYNPPDVAFHIDILTRLGDAFRFSDLQIERVPYQNLTVSVVSPKTLYEMKKSTIRPQDHADAELLRQRFQFGKD